MNRDDLLDDLTRYVAEELLDGDAEDLDSSTPLLELGVLNSLETARMMGFVQKKYGISIPSESLKVENLQTISAIADLVYDARPRQP
ncbi:acyl carrier protein [Myxococcus sp. AM001]|uniref:acyl carrier protein n=1 Tax=Myxococcus vastator TaxID=2709664 RepID=UPI0013D733F4|nr:acyl carrier protein [Myxococcus vastator]NVJ05960.1 acyl carrier protein [Myxococcus sp. AM001]